MKSKFLWMVLGSLITGLLISGFAFLTSYDKNVAKMLGTDVTYKSEWVHTHLSADVYGYLTHGKKSLYFGELPSAECAIRISSSDKATLYVYPMDEDSIIIKYEPRNGIKRTYKMTDYGNFDRILQAFYELTGNEVFNEIVQH